MRIGFNLIGGDAPHLFVEAKDGVRHFMTFKRLEFFEPTSETALLSPKFFKDKDNAEHGFDLYVRPWSWWMLLDNNVELACFHHSSTEAYSIFSIYNPYGDLYLHINLTDLEATLLYKEMKQKVLELPNLSVGSKGILRPAHKVIEFPVKSHVLDVPEAIITFPSQHKSHFRFLEHIPSDKTYLYITWFAVLSSVIIAFLLGKYCYV